MIIANGGRRQAEKRRASQWLALLFFPPVLGFLFDFLALRLPFFMKLEMSVVSVGVREMLLTAADIFQPLPPLSRLSRLLKTWLHSKLSPAKLVSKQLFFPFSFFLPISFILVNGIGAKKFCNEIRPRSVVHLCNLHVLYLFDTYDVI